MFSYIIGKITEHTDTTITVENYGVGYELLVSNFAMKNLEEAEGEVKVFTYLQTREDGVSLFGFYAKEEKDMFLKLISVSGLGPKGAIAILSNISVVDLSIVIAKQNVSALASVKGIGKKTAERLVVELKDKVSVLPEMDADGIVEKSSAQIDDAVQVLCSLGLTKGEALRLCQEAFEDGDSAEDVVSKALARR